MSRFRSFVALLAFLQISIGCSAAMYNSAPETESKPTESEVTTKYNHDTQVTEELRVRDGLPNFFKKLKAGEEVKVGFLGGSITNGGMWRDKLIDWLRSEYPKAKITQINAAIGGKGPDYGACRIMDHLLVHNPDVVFLEFRVNNGVAFQGRAFEGLIPQIWAHNPNIEICSVYTIAKWMKEGIGAGKQTSPVMEEIANRYGITTIEFGLEVMKLLKEDKLVFQKGDAPANGKIIFSNDGVHPVDAGHELYLNVLKRSLKAIENHGTPGPNVIPQPLNKNIFSNASLLPVDKAKFSAAWSSSELTDKAINDDLTDRNGSQKPLFGKAVQTAKQGESLSIDWEGFLLGITSSTAGENEIQIEVSTDGNPGKVYDLNSLKGEIAGGYTFFDEITAGKHTTTIKLVKLASGITFQLGQFLVVNKPKQN